MGTGGEGHRVVFSFGLEFGFMSMSAAAGQPSSAARASEPSMEEILASIRKIIADDQKALEARLDGGPDNAAEAAAGEDAPFPGLNDADDVLELAPPMQVAPPSVLPAPVAPVIKPEPVATPAAAAPAAAPQLLSDSTAQATGAAFQTLANAVFTQNARTMDDLVKEMLRPMLKAWLDENLPSMVERLVRAEIERVARGGR